MAEYTPIYLIECFNMQPIQYVDKNEKPCNIKLNNHRKDAKDPKTKLADKHFEKKWYKFNEHARFTIIGRLTSTNLGREIPRLSLIQRENFSMQKLETLYPKGLNQDLNINI